VGPHFRRVGGGVEDLALLATGATHQRRANALRRVSRHGARTLRRFVVGMSVHLHESEWVATLIEGAGIE